MLHITNGDIVVERMRDGGLPGEYLPWRDVLHDGPVPVTETLEELSALRAAHLAASGYGEEALIARSFAERDATIARYLEFDEIVLWFEHDLYDQLQLLQVLDWMADRPQKAPVALVVIGTYPGIDRFIGLGQLSPGQLVGLLESRIPATREHFQAARAAWLAFRQPDPRSLARMLEEEVPALPYLRGAALRLLEELPAASNGLSRTERAVLGVTSQKAVAPAEAFAEVQSLEQRPWMGDWSFWTIIAALTQGMEPLLATESGQPFRHPPLQLDGEAFEAQRLLLTRAGREVLENRRDAVKLRRIDRWLGGTHLAGALSWRWDEEAQALVEPC